MSIFVSNYNQFLTTMQIKQNYISRKSGIDENKLSCILTGKQVASEDDLDVLSKAVGKSTGYFLNFEIKINTNYAVSSVRTTFYGGNPTKKQGQVANNLLELMENVDIVMSAKGLFFNMGNK